MGIVNSRYNIDDLNSSRRRSQLGEAVYSHSLDRNHFSNYFLMGGERFEVNDPDYLFGDTCDLNFLSCTKPYALPYKQAQKNLLTNLNSKHKAANKVSSRVGRLSSPFNILTGHHREPTSSMKLDANKQQLLNNSRGSSSEPSKPIVMHVNIRKETLRLVNSCNIEFYFDAEVDCSISIFYFCTRETTLNGISYRPQQANHRSGVYRYKKGLNQKFDQQEHTIQPCKFDEDLLTYKPLDEDGNYNSGAVFPLVIHCVALDGPMPRQSHSLVATIEKRQLDESYSIKALKQLIFVDGVQYILQDIYGIEHKHLTSNSPKKNKTSGSSKTINSKQSNSNQMIRALSNSVVSNLDNISSNLNLSDTASLSSVDFGGLSSRGQNRGSIGSNQLKSLIGENAECVICMSEERDTMLLPCRHLCLCSSCAQSLRFQASSCPICRCPFKAALNFRPIRHDSSSSTSKQIRPQKSTSSTELDYNRGLCNRVSRKTDIKRQGSHQNLQTDITGERQQDTSMSIDATGLQEQLDPNRRDSLTTSATPLLSSRLAADVVISVDGSGGCNASTASSSSYWSLNTNVNVPTGGRDAGSATVPTAATETSSQLEMRPMKPFT